MNLLQYCFCFMSWIFGHKSCRILAAQPRIKSILSALEGEVLTTGPPGKSLHSSSCFQVLQGQNSWTWCSESNWHLLIGYMEINFQEAALWPPNIMVESTIRNHPHHICFCFCYILSFSCYSSVARVCNVLCGFFFT